MSLRDVGQAVDMATACPRRSYTVPGQSTGSTPLDFLRGISGSQTVAGQHNREPNSEPALWTNWIYDTTGKFPGLWSGDFLYEQDDIDNRGTMIDEAKSQWEQGALINLMYHAAPPDLGEPCNWDPGVINHPLSDDQWNDLITDGGYLNTQWKARLDVISVFLQDLKDSGVQVLWRPFHEMNQGEFWWGGRPGPQGTLRLYQITHDYMVGTKGLTNLTWVWDVQDLDFTWADYNPGDGYWDVFAMDMYGDGYTTQKYTTMLQIAGDSPIAIGECEVLPTADELTAQPRWTFFMAWAELVQSGNSVQEIQDLYSAANVITLGQMPGWGAQTANLYVFHQGEENDGELWYSSNNNINWTTDTQVQNVGMSESPSAVLWADGISVFHQGGENNAGSLWYSYFDGTNWYGDTLVPNLGMSGSPSTVVYNGLLYVFHQGFGNNGQLWYSSNDGTNWTADTQVQNLGMSESPSAVLWAGGISVFHQGGENTPGSLWYDYFDGTNWYGDTLVPNLGISGSPSTVVYNGLLYVFHQGPNNDGQLWYSVNDGTNWTADTQVQNVGMSGSPWAVLWAGGISVFHQGFGNNGSLWYSYFDGTNWYPDTLVPNLSISGSPSCVVR